MPNTASMIPGIDISSDPHAHWFGGRDSVVYGDDGHAEVFAGGTLIGSFGPRDRGERNAILVGLAADPNAHLGQMAKAFGIAAGTLRLIRRQYETDGLASVVGRAPGGKKSKVSLALRHKLEAMFDEGVSITAAHKKVEKRFHLARSTVGKVRAEWDANRGERQRLPTSEVTATSAQATFALTSHERVEVSIAQSRAPDTVAADSTSSDREPDGTSPAAQEEDRGADEPIAPTEPTGGRFVQHIGTWMMVAMLARQGLHTKAEEIRAGRVEATTLRIALDAVIMSLSIGQHCVEGVRRLATPSAPTLLRADQAPTASWVRRVLGRFAVDAGGARLHLGMAGAYLAAAREDTTDEPVVFYVDNHLRPYSGRHVVRRGWRMQDKRPVPGISDFYVHDEDGRPVLRIDAPQHGSLTEFLTPIAKLLRLALPEKKILLGFDRGGAFAAQMAELRDERFEFVTYERRPFPLLHAPAFEQTIAIDDEKVGLCESRTNLGRGRGRVRRIALRMPDGRQVNVLAVSEQPAEWLVGVLRGRWNQENGFKHGVERWGINQLDGRRTTHYPPDTVIPNPARRRLDRALRIAKVREGAARSELARLVADNPRRARFEREIVDALAQRNEIEALRPSVPKHTALDKSELAGKLVHHQSEYKFVIDTVRIACANAESDLAGELAPALRKPAEAKRVVANLLTAPGRVRVGPRTIAVTVHPAGTRNELAAIAALLDTVNGWKLTLPGDPEARPLRFGSSRS